MTTRTLTTFAHPLALALLTASCSPAEADKPPADTAAEVVDEDQDGVSIADDCDDADPLLGDRAEDADCDGVPTADDCDDQDPASTTRAEDADCDGTLTADDCNDEDPASTTRAEDADCDGTLTADDCDDEDPTSLTRADDADCDGLLTADDCDDADPASLSRTEDADCDGVATVDDCMPDDPSVPRVATWTEVARHDLATAPSTASWCDGAWGGQGPGEVGGRTAWLMSSDWNSLWVPLPFSDSDDMLAIEAAMHLEPGNRSGNLAAMIDPDGVCHLSQHGVAMSYSNTRCSEGDTDCLYVNTRDSGRVHSGSAAGLFSDWVTFRFEIFRSDGLVQLKVDDAIETCFYASESDLAGTHMKFNANTSCCSERPDLGASDLVFETGM